jgi:predicted regulator of Ras-like GTPase activity (Roadblock/LC7/MglB family)
MADDIRRLSNELARDPSSLVFLQLGEALRREGQVDVALRIALRGVERHPRNTEAHDLVARIAVDRRDLARAFEEWEAVLKLDPTNVSAMKGLGYVCFQYGRFADAEWYLGQAAARGGGAAVSTALETVRRTSDDASASNDGALPADPQWLFADLLVEEGQTALLLDGNGYVVGGLYMDDSGEDLGEEIGAQLSGISDEVQRSTRHLDLGEWRSIMFETHEVVVAMAPSADDSLVVVAADRATPLGLIRRLLERCADRAASWLKNGGRQ